MALMEAAHLVAVVSLVAALAEPLAVAVAEEVAAVALSEAADTKIINDNG